MAAGFTGTRRRPRPIVFAAAAIVAAFPMAVQALPPGSSVPLGVQGEEAAACHSFNAGIDQSPGASQAALRTGQASLLNPASGQAAMRGETLPRAAPAGEPSTAAVFSLELPEPDAYAMLLAGLAVIGLIARRRMRN